MREGKWYQEFERDTVRIFINEWWMPIRQNSAHRPCVSSFWSVSIETSRFRGLTTGYGRATCTGRAPLDSDEYREAKSGGCPSPCPLPNLQNKCFAHMYVQWIPYAACILKACIVIISTSWPRAYRDITRYHRYEYASCLTSSFVSSLSSPPCAASSPLLVLNPPPGSVV